MSVQALLIGVLSSFAGPRVEQVDVALDGPGQEVLTGQFRAVVTIADLTALRLVEGRRGA